MNNRQKLIDIMSNYKITAWHVSKMLGVSMQTVRIWRCVSEKNIPNHKLELLVFKLKGESDN